MRNRVVHEEYDLRIYPEEVIETNERVVLGDMHGNALKFLFLLIKFNIVKLDAANYRLFATIYLKKNPTPPISPHVIDTPDLSQHAPLTEDELSTCRAIIDSLLVNKNAVLCLIGDLLADRGKNDILTLLIIKQLSLAKMILEIIFSNHDLILIHKIESAICMKHRDPLLTALDYEGVETPEHRISLEACIKTIATGFITQTEIFELYNYYKKHLALIRAYEQPEGLVLVSHAPIGFNNIDEIASLFRVAKPLDTRDNLLSTIQAIHEKFQRFVEENTITTKAVTLAWMKAWPSAQHALMKLIWSRDTPVDVMRPPMLPDGTPLEWAHGHTEFTPSDPERYSHIHSLDGILGFKESLVSMMINLRLVKPTHQQGVYALLDPNNPARVARINKATEEGYFPTGDYLIGECPVLLIKNPKPAAHATATSSGPGFFSIAPSASTTFSADTAALATDKTAGQTSAASASLT